MSKSSKIILNTLAAYGQSVIGLVLTLFSARWLLLALGQTDYGLYGVVGSLILLITFLTGGLSVGVSRFYAFSIGKHGEDNDASNEELMRWFNAALSIHLVLPLVFVIVGTPLGEFAIRNWLTVPLDRVDACIWVFRASLLTAFFSVASVPFVALFTAHQKIYVISLFGILRSLAQFLIAFALLKVSSDRLIVYAACMACVGVALPILTMVAARLKFKGCRVHPPYMFRRESTRKLFAFTGWKMFGMSCVALRSQGTPIVVNLYYGPIVNAAYTVANALSTQATALSTAMTRSFQPAVVSAEGSGNRVEMLSMAMRVCKFGSLLVTLFAVPAILEMDNLLYVWLVNPPEYAAPICQWLLAMLLVDRLTGGQMLAVNAYGKIAVYEMVQGTILMSAVPLMWLFFNLGLGPVSVGYAMFTTMTIYCTGRIIFAKVLTGFPFILWVKEIAIPMLTVILLSAAVGRGFHHYIDEGGFRLVLTTVAAATTAFFASWWILLSSDERTYMLKVPRRLLRV